MACSTHYDAWLIVNMIKPSVWHLPRRMAAGASEDEGVGPGLGNLERGELGLGRANWRRAGRGARALFLTAFKGSDFPEG